MASVTSTITVQPGGMNAAMHPGIIPETDYARGVNVSIRGGFVKTRPGFHGFSSDIPAMLVPGTDLFQGAGVWRNPGGTFIVTVFSGVVRLTTYPGGVTTEFGPYLLPTGVIHILQAGPYLVFHGGGLSFLVLDWDAVGGLPIVKKSPLVPESLTDDSWDTRMQGIVLADRVAEIIAAAAAEEPPQVVTYEAALATAFAALKVAGVSSYPHGTVSCFAHSRIHMSSELLGHRYFVSSDIMLPRDQGSVLKWWEDMYLNGGGGLGLPDEMGEIRGMAVMQNSQDTASGIGPLIVLAQDGAAAFSVNLPREGTFDLSVSSATGAISASAKLLTPGWKDRQIAQVLFYGGGTESPWSLARINGDLVYRSQDGMRSIKSSATASGGSVVANTSMSAEVAPFVALDSGALLDRISAASADNRVLMTAGRTGAAGHRGLIALDVRVLSTLDRSADTTNDTNFIGYDGLWTGVNTAKIMTLDGGFVIVAADGRMYNLSSSQWDVVDGVRRDIECQWMTRQDNLKKPGIRKRFEYAEVWVTDMSGDVSMDLYFRPDNFPYWTKTGDSYSWHCPLDLPPQEHRRIRFKPSGSNRYNYDGAPLLTGESFQFLAVWRGQATIQRLTFSAAPETESPPLSTSGCDFASIELEEGQIVQNDFSYPG